MSTSTPKYTDQQLAAINTRDVSLAISAGAGCGKTTVLTRRFLSYLEPGQGDDPLSGIVAITFTDRAAREMRNRIRSDCHDKLQKCTDAEAVHWLRIVRGLDSARVSTIHSFCSTLLRANAVTAGIDPRFGLLEEAVESSFQRRVVKDVIHEMLEEQQPDCMELVLQYGLEATLIMMRELLLSRFEINPESFADVDAAQLMACWKKEWFEQYLPAMMADIVNDRLTVQLMQLLRLHTPDNKEMQRRRLFLLEHIPRLEEALKKPAILKEIADCAKVQGGGTKKVWSSEEVYASVRDALKAFRDKKLKPAMPAFEIDDEAFAFPTSLTLAALNVVERIAERFVTEKKRQGLLDFDDLLLQTRNLLRDSSSVRNRVAAGIDFLMVDEFQDTDPVQADIVRMLCGEHIFDGKLFLVGDVKQSIYRFRRADPTVFTSLREEVPERGRLPLSTNFRSQPEILKFVNCMFSQPMGESYEPLVPGDEKQRSPTPAIEFLFASPAADPELPKPNADDQRRCEATWISRRIQQLLQDETPRIRDTNAETRAVELRRVQPGDIVILFRSLSNVSLYENELRAKGLNYYLVRGRAFFAQQEVFDFVNLCSYLDDPDDAISLAGLLRSPWFGLTDDTLLSLVRSSGTLQQALRAKVPQELPEKQYLQVQRAAKVLQELREKKDRLPIAQLLELALEHTGYDAALLLEHLGRRKLANLRKLLEMARAFDQSDQFTLKDFAVRMEESIREETREELAATHPETSDVIRLMTIHQAKGLEFPVVIVADMDPKGSPNSFKPKYHANYGPLIHMPKRFGHKEEHPAITMHKYEEQQGDAKESLRVLYVAMTRAADYLILSAGLPPTKVVTSAWMNLISQQFDIETGVAVINSVTGRLNIGEMAAHEIPDIKVHTECPEVRASRVEHKIKTLSVSKFREAINKADDIPLPETVRVISPAVASRKIFSVTEVETADAELHQEREATNLAVENSAESESKPHVDATRLGTFIHEVIERIDYQQPQPIDFVVDRVMQQQSVQDDAFRESALERLRPFYASALFAELAAAKSCFREIDFRLHWEMDQTPDDVIISGQIDSLFQDAEGKWHIIDFKTGRITSMHAEKALAHYEIQLALYTLAFEKLYQTLPESVRLIVLGDTVEQIEYQLLREKRVALKIRIDAAIVWLRSQNQEAER